MSEFAKGYNVELNNKKAELLLKLKLFKEEFGQEELEDLLQEFKQNNN